MTVQTTTVVYRLTAPNNMPKTGLRSVAVIPSTFIVHGWTGNVYKLILRPQVQVVTAPLRHDSHGYPEFEMIVVDGMINETASAQEDKNTIIIEADRASASRKRDSEGTQIIPPQTPLFLRPQLRFC